MLLEASLGKSVSQSVSRNYSVKYISYQLGVYSFWIVLKTFLGLTVPNQCRLPCHKVNIELVIGNVLGKKLLTSMIPIYSTVLYDRLDGFKNVTPSSLL